MEVGTVLRIKPAWLNHRTTPRPYAEVIEINENEMRARVSFQVGQQTWYPIEYIREVFDEVPDYHDD